MPTLFITGARGGLGKEFVRQYTVAGWKVIAPAHSDMEVSSRSSIEAFVNTLGGEPIDILINNAGIRNSDPAACRLGKFRTEAWMPTFAVNVVGPALVTQGLLPNLREGCHKKILTLSSRLGSIGAGGGPNSGGASSSYYAYRASKASLHQVNHCLAIDLGPDGFICALLNPGWVRTAMGGINAPVSPEVSVKNMRKIIAELEPKHNGKFIDLDGSIMPW